MQLTEDLDKLARACRILEMEGHGDMTLGHLSLRDPQGRGYWLKRNAYGLGEITSAADFVLVDGEIGPTKLDVQMLDWLRASDVPHTVVATKLDKVKPSKLATRKKELAKGAELDPGDVMWVSAAKGTGIEDLASHVLMMLS